ncbi:MAG: tetratricopeptide repeat protein, partial [Acidobacteria bacterium]|nr:tetratricopeptide repeat protein [Acidobacteriota bacterium]
ARSSSNSPRSPSIRLLQCPFQPLPTAGFRFKQREEALRCAEESVRLNPGYALGWRTRGALLRDLGRHEEGLDCYDRALAIDPDDPVTLQNRRNALEALGRPVTQSPKASPARSGK